MPSLFRRKSSDIVNDAVAEADPPAPEPPRGGKRQTLSKRELGKVTPKRPIASVRREPPPTDRKEAAKRLREKQRAAREEQRAGMMAGDERYLMPRDRGPERALVRDIVDSRRNVGTWFFSFAFILLAVMLMGRAVPVVVVNAANALWLFMGFAVLVDSVFLCRRVGKLVRERYPKTQQKIAGLYAYAIMRSLSFRRMRIPKPRVAIGAKV